MLLMTEVILAMNLKKVVAWKVRCSLALVMDHNKFRVNSYPQDLILFMFFMPILSIQAYFL